MPTETRFELQAKKSECEIHTDKASGIVKIEFVGDVDIVTAKFIIKATLDSMKTNDLQKLLVNRTLAHSFSEEANDWLKDFLLENRHRFNFKVSRVAIITLDSHKVGLYAHFMKTAFQIIFPGVKLASFEFEDSAIEWMV